MLAQKITPDQNIYLWLLLAMTPKVGPITGLKLIKHFGNIENIYAQNLNTLSSIVNATIAKLILNKESLPIVEESLQLETLMPNHYIISIDHPLYPKELLQIVDPPLVLFLKGNINLLQQQKFAIVGTRHPTHNGTTNAFKFAQALSNHGLTIVSGMATGIDHFAHQGAITGKGSTIGVIGTGIDQIYPKSNTALYNAVIEQNGLLLSEFSISTPPLLSNFPRRNRIIAGLSIGLLVVESAIDGGSMISANLALEMGREVMAIPGSIHNPVVRGCHKLIKNGAKLIENSNDILEDLQLQPSTLQYNHAENTNPMLITMGYDPITIDEICSTFKLDLADACAQILELELAGHIVNCGGGKYQRISN